MHKDFLREIAEKSCASEKEAGDLFRCVMEVLPDDAILRTVDAASELLEDLKDEILLKRRDPRLVKGFTYMFHELSIELQRRTLHRICE